MNQIYDVLVIGSGPGGYTCAIKNAQLGRKVVLVEKYENLGGTCLNVGCIPSKALLDSSERYSQALHGTQIHGIEIPKVGFDFKKMMLRKEKVITQTADGIQFLMKKNKVEVITGEASFMDVNTVSIKIKDNSSINISAKNIVIATGSKPINPSFAPIDKKQILSSTEALALKQVPDTLTVIGAGAIGLELGSVFSRLGAKVTVIEYADRIATAMDETVSKELFKILKKQGISFKLSTELKAIKKEKEGLSLTLQAGNNTEEIRSQYALMALGRRPYTEGLNLSNVGVQLDERGFVEVDTQKRTVIPNIFAIGDVTAGPMLAHKAEEEAVFVAEIIDGQKPVLHPNLIPSVVYTWPEAASVGASEQQLKNQKISYKVGSFSMRGLGRARAGEETEGFVKVLTHATTDEILGVHMVAARAADLIAEATVAMAFKASSEDIGRICHAHPTFAEAFKEAALGASLGSINT